MWLLRCGRLLGKVGFAVAWRVVRFVVSCLAFVSVGCGAFVGRFVVRFGCFKFWLGDWSWILLLIWFICGCGFWLLVDVLGVDLL